MTRFELENIEYICKLLCDCFKIPVCLMDKNMEIIAEYPSTSQPFNPMFSSKLNHLKELIDVKAVSKQPIFFSSSAEAVVAFGIMVVEKEDVFAVLGPVTETEFSDETLTLLMNDVNAPLALKESLRDYYKSLLYFSKMNLIYVCTNFYYMLYQKKLDPVTIRNFNKANQLEEVHSGAAELNIIERRENDESLHHEYLIERQIFQCIKDGDPSEVVKNWRKIPDKNFGVLSKKSQIRSRKNLGITGITLATRSAIEGGLHHETAYTLSDLFIQNIEELTTLQEINTFIDEVYVEFSMRVKKSKLQKYSKPINRAINYIYQNLYNTIKLSDIAHVVMLHPNYLSYLFKKEAGVSIREYIQTVKISEAKSLLLYTDNPISKISTQLCYHDQSYFTKSFKKITACTPKQYRKQNGII